MPTNTVKGVKGFQPVPLSERFWAKVDRQADDKCWPWIGTKYQNGYGQFYRNGRHVRATRVAWELHNNQPFPAGSVACHRCDNPGCVNPRHIWPGTMSENMRDSIKKRRNWQTRKDACHRGHPFDEKNTGTNSKGQRYCRECLRLASIALRKRLRALGADR